MCSIFYWILTEYVETHNSLKFEIDISTISHIIPVLVGTNKVFCNEHQCRVQGQMLR